MGIGIAIGIAIGITGEKKYTLGSQEQSLE
jgi:hypothetical protein